jgi:hypothetical protein
MGLGHSPAVVPEGLVFYFDPINTRSYAGTGLTGFNLIDTSIVGAFTNSPVYDVANKGSIYFDGVDDYINIPNATSLNPTTITISCWVKFNTFTNNANIISKGFTSVSSPFIQYSLKMGDVESTRDLYGFQISNNGVNATVTSSARLITNKYYFLTVTYDGTTLKLYKDGIQDVNTTTSAGALASYATPVQIGRWGTQGSQYFNGNVAAAIIYNRALSSTEILQNYNATKKRFSPEENILTNGLVLYLDAGNNLSYAGTGLTSINIAGVGATGVLTNGVGFVANSGGTFVFDGTNDYIDCGNDSSLSALGGTTNITASAWVYYTAYGGGGQPYSVITVKGFPWTWLLENPSNTFTFRISAGGADVNVVDTSTHLLNTWYYVVGSYDGSAMRIYVNGVLKNTRSQAGTLGTNSETAKIGTYQGTNYNLTGRIANVSIYNKTLSSTEILQNYNALKGRYGLS